MNAEDTITYRSTESKLRNPEHSDKILRAYSDNSFKLDLQNMEKSIVVIPPSTETFLTATETPPPMNLIDNYDNFKLKKSKNYV